MIATRRIPLRFRVIAAVCLSIGLCHAAGLAFPSFSGIAWTPGYPPWRHVIFILIDSAAALLFLSRPPWAIWPFLALAAQVVYSHGGHAWTIFSQTRRIDWRDAAVILFTAAALAAFCFERRSSRPRARRRSGNIPAGTV